MAEFVQRVPLVVSASHCGTWMQQLPIFGRRHHHQHHHHQHILHHFHHHHHHQHQHRDSYYPLNHHHIHQHHYQYYPLNHNHNQLFNQYNRHQYLKFIPTKLCICSWPKRFFEPFELTNVKYLR